MCATVRRHLANAAAVMAGPVESNGSLLLGGWLKVTCGLTASTPTLALDLTLGNEYGKTIPLPFTVIM